MALKTHQAGKQVSERRRKAGGNANAGGNSKAGSTQGSTATSPASADSSPSTPLCSPHGRQVAEQQQRAAARHYKQPNMTDHSSPCRQPIPPSAHHTGDRLQKSTPPEPLRMVRSSCAADCRKAMQGGLTTRGEGLTTTRARGTSQTACRQPTQGPTSRHRKCRPAGTACTRPTGRAGGTTCSTTHGPPLRWGRRQAG